MRNYTFRGDHGVSINETQLTDDNILDIQINKIPKDEAIRLLIEDNEALHEDREDLFESLDSAYDIMNIVKEASHEESIFEDFLSDICELFTAFDIEFDDDKYQKALKCFDRTRDNLEMIYKKVNQDG